MQEKIDNDLKRAMREKDELGLSVLRLLLSAIKNKAIALRSGEALELTDRQIIEVIIGEVKKRKDSIEAYAAGGRNDLADKEQKEIVILNKYLPEQLSDREIEKVIREIIAASSTDPPAGEAGFGKIMGQAMAKLKGRADGKIVGEIVKRVISEKQ